MPWYILHNFHSLALKGFAEGSIVFDATRGIWMIIDKTMKGPERKISQDFNIIGEQVDDNSKSTMPTGLQTWQLFDEDCEGTRKLKLSPVCTIF